MFADGIAHTSRLCETHRIVMDGDALPGGYEAAMDVALMHAESYARSRGFELGRVSALHRSDGQVGVEFVVYVGHGDIHLDQSTPGALDRWRWSGPAMSWWRDIFNRADGREGRVLSLVDAAERRAGRVHARPGDPATTVSQAPPWMRRGEGGYDDE